ncbi:SulP family inorganic anion transporter [Alteribacter keqinensis]|uniref:Solute carrier 26 family protein n=1 Tax=Alteribacter keqinensis TaxID=2483800 RepID=A0A3M7TMU1_9BACI|nr:solute carrier family 26 protein [Alteribacter keqinensis]RNA66855.1 solute carrier 26 family protein [Alteribacter keqinensis]
MREWLPILGVLKSYDLRQDLRGDLNAGLIVAIMLVPQGMAYAMLAGLPPVMGLYAATVPILIYALFGTSRQLAVGPVAMVSLLVFSGVSGFAEPGSQEYISLVLLLALMVGGIQLAMGVLRLGVVTKFISHGVISGFTSAAAIIIGFSQMKHLVGIDLESSKNVFLIVGEISARAGEIHLPTLGIGVGSILVLIFMKRRVKKIPGPLAVVVLGMLAVVLLNLHNNGVAIIRDVPAGLPGLTIPALDPSLILALLPTAITISIIGFVESYAMANVIASKEKYRVHANGELKGLGLSNIGAAFFSGFPVTGGFSRSAVNYDAGARTPVASIITAALIVIVLLFFTSWFYYLPQAVLAAIILVAVYKLIDVKEAVHLWKVKRIDGVTLALTFAATLILGIEWGIAAGIAFSLFVFIYQSSKPHIAELGYVDDLGLYRNVSRFDKARTFAKTLILRIDSPLYFANMEFIKEYLHDQMVRKADLKHVILDFSGVNDVDAIALDELEEWIRSERENHQVETTLVNVKGPVRDLLAKAGWVNKFGPGIQYPSIDQALTGLQVNQQ